MGFRPVACSRRAPFFPEGRLHQTTIPGLPVPLEADQVIVLPQQQPPRLLERPAPHPFAKAVVERGYPPGVRAKLHRQRRPLAARPQQPDQPVQQHPVIPPGPPPAPVHLMQVAAHRRAGEHYPEPDGQERGEEANRPARLDVARGPRRPARLGVHDLPRQRIVGRPPAARLVRQTRHPRLLVAMQPEPHHILAAVVDRRDHRHPIPPVIQQHHVRPQGHAPHRLPAHTLQLRPLLLRQFYHQHAGYLPFPQPAKSVPHMWSHA